MLALAAAAHSGQNPTEVLLIIAVIGAAIFWRILLKVALAVILVLFAVLLVTGALAVVHDIIALVP